MKYTFRIMNRFLTLSAIILLAAALPSQEAEARQSRKKADTAQTSGTSRKRNSSAKNAGTTKKTVSAKKGKGTAAGKTAGRKAAPKWKETSAEMKRRQADTQKEIARTKEEIRRNEAEVKKGLGELGRLRTDIEAGRKLVDEAAAQVKDLDSRIGGLEKEIASEEETLARLRADYLRTVRKMRARRNSSSALAFIFSSENFSQAMRRIRYLRQFAGWREKRSAEITAKVEALKMNRELLADARRDKDAALGRRMAAQKALNTRYERQDALVGELRANGKALQSHLARKQAEANDLRNRISALIAEEQRKAREEEERKARLEAERREREEAERKALLAAEERKEKEREERERLESGKAASGKDSQKDKKEKENKGKEENRKNRDYAEARKRKPRSEAEAAAPKADTKSSAKGNAARAAGNFAAMRGSLPRPVAGEFRVTSRFGRHSLPELPDVMYDNPGIDAETAQGASAQAVYGGKVSGVYMIPGYSTVVIVNHGGYYTVYGNISSPAVKVGDTVKQGEALGRLAPSEENPSSASIHFEVWKNREKQNPLDWIR